MTDQETLINKLLNQSPLIDYYTKVVVDKDNNLVKFSQEKLQAADKILAGSFIKVDELIDETEEEDD